MLNFSVIWLDQQLVNTGNNAASQTCGQLLCKVANGALSWDADGTGGGAALAFTHLLTSAFTLPPAKLAVLDLDILA